MKKRKKSSPARRTLKLRRRIALIGFRGCGKSVTGQELARLYGTVCISLDQYIEEKEQKSITQITELNGWQYFRERELSALQELSTREDLFILDTGGGVVENADGTISQEKIDILRKYYFCIYLAMNDEALLARLDAINRSKSRPALPQGNEAALLRRKPMYAKAAHAVVDVTNTRKHEAATRIVSLLGD
ncbi:MAG: shikimate kinase [Leptospiraceae bacterium]|nr:shikimate kinase [Leptospiraceae bacterium]